MSVLGLDDAEGPPSVDGGLPDAEIEALLSQRDEARADRDFARADDIRDQLSDAGVTIEDGPDGTRWIRR